MPILKKVPRLVGIFFAGLGTLILVLMAVFYWLVQRDPDELINKYLAQFSTQTGLQINFKTIDVTLLPLPMITLSELVIKNDELNLRVPWLSARPGLLKILRGDFSPAYINIIRPRFEANLPIDLTEFQQAGQYIDNKLSFLSGNEEKDGKSFITDCDIDIIDGQIKILGSNATKFIINNLGVQLGLSLPDAVNCALDISSINFANDQKNIFSLTHLKAESLFNPQNFFSHIAEIKLSFNGTARNVVKTSSFYLSFSNNGSKWNANGELNGDLDLQDIPVPISIKGAASGLGAEKQIDFKDIEWRLDRDNGGLDARLFLPGSREGLLVIGKFVARRLSLTQWLGFARNLCPGLQLSLDNIFNASLDFKLNPQRLEVPVIVATCNGSRFTGTGGVSDFARPVVFLKLKTDMANLGLALPESLGKSPKPPVFSYPPLTPLPGEPLQPGETGVGYNINLAADKLVYGPLLIEKTSLRIYPGRMDAIRLEDVLLDAKGTLYGGQITGNCILGAAKELPINIVGTGHDINANLLGKNLSVLPVNSGKIDVNVNVFSQGKELVPFLANLHGSVITRGKNIAFSGVKEIFSFFDLKSAIRTASVDKDRIFFDGKWLVNAQNTLFSVNTDLNGKIRIGESGLDFHGLPSSLTFRALKSSAFLNTNTTIKANGQASFSADLAELQNAKIILGDNAINGNFKYNIKNKNVQGNLATHLANVPDFLKKAGFSSFEFPTPLQNLQLKTEFSWRDENLKLSKLRAAFGELVFTGDLSLSSRQAKPYLEFSLAANNVDANIFMKKSASKPDKKAWNFKIMNEFNASGDLKIKNLSMLNLVMENIHAPMRLENGNLSIGPNTGRFYGAPIQNRSYVDFSKNGMIINSVLAVNDFDLGALAQSRKMESAINGRATLDAAISAQITGPGQMPGRLKGNWKFSAKNGSWQDKKGGKPTNFEILNASGNIDEGILKSNDFLLKSPEMEVKGTGWLNMGNDKIDCNFNVNMRNLPDFPLHLYGNLNNIKTSIGAGKMVMNAIGGITSGFVNILGGVVQGAWKLFW